ncbi:MAG: sodium/proline symporter [Myxococcota bacterium]
MHDWMIEAAAVAAYLAVLLVIGAVASRRMKDVTDYFAAGKSLGFWAAAFSARATGESAWLLLGLTGMGAASGVVGFWVVLGEVLGVALAWLQLCRPFKLRADAYGAITVPDYLEARFEDASHVLRLVAACALVVFVTIYVSAQIDATGTAFESFLGVGWTTGALIGFGVVLAYSVSGGFLAVVWSDVFQGTLMVLGLVALPAAALLVIGGPGELVAELRAIDPALLSWTGGQPISAVSVATVVGLVLIGLGFLGSPQIFVRFIALRDVAEIPRGTAVAVTWTVLADSGAVLTGMAGRALLDGTDLGNGGQEVLPLLVRELFGPLVIGLYIAIVLSAIMSTVDSLLVLAGSAAVRDVYQKVLHPELPDAALVPASRAATLGLAMVALALALGVGWTVEGRTVFWFVIFGWSGIAATFCPTMILSLFWPRFTRQGALAAMATGFCCVPLFKFGAPLLPGVGPVFAALAELPPSFVASGVAGIAVSLVTAPRR